MRVRGEDATVRILPVIIVLFLTSGLRASASDAREAVSKIVEQIQRADYEGDRAALKRFHGVGSVRV